MKQYNNVKKIALVVLGMLAFFTFGLYIGFNNKFETNKVAAFLGKDTSTPVNADLTPFWKVWNDINEKYPGADKVTDQERVYGAISGLVGSLKDPYSVFFNPDETKSFEEQIAGSFSGVGMEVGMKDEILTVISPLKDTPASRAGILAGDKILKIDDKTTNGMGVDEAIKLIRGEKGTSVTLIILHDGEKEPKEIKIVRDTIDIPTLDTELRPDGIFVIRLYSFSANSSNLFRNAMKKFVATKSDKLLLDLRGNPGGYLNAAIDMSSWFLPTGKTVVSEDYGTNKDRKDYRSLGYNIFNDKLKFVILIDQGSASASEIVAGAMQDQKRAILVGHQSYGKGSVQEVLDITPDTIFKVTVAKWLTPNGTSISLKGLTPDYKVDVTKDDLLKKNDPQLNKAVELLNNWPGIK